MKLVHFADTHIGFRQYQRTAAGGMNQREQDVARAFTRAIDKTIEIAPELVVIAGDLFHTVRPPNTAILFAYREFMRLRQALPESEVVLIAGNHDTPRTIDTGCILRLFSALRVHVVDAEPKRLNFFNGKLSVFALPNHYRPLPALEPDETAQHNVLVMHDKIEGLIKHFDKAGDLKPEQLNAAAWDYVALGDYHVYHSVAPNAFFSGATEYTSSDIWREVDRESEKPEHERGKGIIERDLETGAQTFHRIGGRTVVDLTPIDGTSINSEDLTTAILAAAESCAGGIGDKVVRLVVKDVPKHVIRDLDHRALRALKASAVNFLLDTRKPEEKELHMPGPLAKVARPSLAEIMREFLQTRELTPGVDRTEFVTKGMEYLEEAGRKEATNGAQAIV